MGILQAHESEMKARITAELMKAKRLYRSAVLTCKSKEVHTTGVVHKPRGKIRMLVRKPSRKLGV